MLFVSLKILAAAGLLLLLSTAWLAWAISKAPLWEDEDV